jgi:hypothetical protein
MILDFWGYKDNGWKKELVYLLEIPMRQHLFRTDDRVLPISAAISAIVTLPALTLA